MTTLARIAAAIFLLLAAQVQQAPPVPVPVPPPAPTPATTPTASPQAQAGQKPEPVPEISQAKFDAFLSSIRSEARGMGVSEATLDAALNGLEAIPVVIARDRNQPESTLTLDEYVAQRLSTQRIQTGRAMAERHTELLTRVESAYGVPPHIMVAIWGLESNFGSITGSYPTIAALATLAYDGRRPLFRSELFSALRIVDAGRVTAADLKGSWAGAMGQPQFIPSSYLRHAVDFDEDGKPDIWTSVADVFGSMANYLKAAGWQAGSRWGREVRISSATMDRIQRAVPNRPSGCRAVREMTLARPIGEWRTLGVTLADGSALPASDLHASLVRGRNRHFLVYPNFHALLGYNCSNAYAVSVGLLADAIASR